MSMSLTSSLQSLYPRETSELSTMLAKHGVSIGRPEDIRIFPEKLASDAALQQSFKAFVHSCRVSRGGPVSLSAMLHLTLAAIGGPGAADLGPEMDGSTSLITAFLESIERWPETVFPEMGDVEQPGPQRERPPAERRVRSIAASLASQAAPQPMAWLEQDGMSLADIADRLSRLEENQVEAARRLDGINDQLQRMQGSSEASGSRNGRVQLEAPDNPAPASVEPNHLAKFLRAEGAGLPVIAAASGDPDPAATESNSSVGADELSTHTPMSDPNPVKAGSPIPTISNSARATIPLNGVGAAEPDHREPTSEWKDLFRAPKRTRRSPLRAIILAAVILVSIVAAVLFYLHMRSDSPAGNSDTAPAPVPAAASRPGDTSIPEQPSAATLQTRSSGSSSSSGALAAKRPANEHAKDRVLGAREHAPTQENGEDLEPRSPVFVSASVMEAHLAYAPKPVHPAVAGLAGLGGMVIMDVVVDAKGYVDSVRVLGGHHLLRDAAVNAVRTWRYRPVLRNGQPIAVRTTVRLDFSPDAATPGTN